MTQDQIDEIYQAKNRIRLNKTRMIKAYQKGDVAQVRKIQQQNSVLLNEIKRKYAILLD